MLEKKLESGFSVLGETVPAVDGAALGGLEGNFTLSAAVGTDCFMKLAGTVVVGTGAPALISLIHGFDHADNLHT